MKIKKFHQINEIFGLKKKKDLKVVNKIDSCVEDIINFLKDNNIKNWTDFTASGKFDRWSVNKIIDSSCENKEDLDEVRYKLKLKLSNYSQLKSMLQEYEEMEEYRKCSEIQIEMESKK
jgi:Glu-tRNA(Gln) amidotransferase subunit E-like FAD-binding protein